MINLRKILSIIIDLINCFICIITLGAIALLFHPSEIIHMIILSLITLATLFKTLEMNQNGNSIGWKISKKIVKKDNRTISINQLIFIVLCITPIIYILFFIFEVIRWFILSLF